ncbi:MAG: hypothetical protein JW793_02625, partial [Acidobacteria bacterium]|nr:hypothetical protein [Acidobacteriota bacterium]
MKKGKVILTAVLLSLLAFSSARAEYSADITYDYSMSGTSWVFDFTVNNESTGDSTGDLDYFMIDFDADDWSYYTNLSWLT